MPETLGIVGWLRNSIGTIIPRGFWALLIILLPTAGVPSQAAEVAPPWKTNRPIATIAKELYRKHPKPRAAALVSTQYVGPKLELMEWQGLEIDDDVHESQMARWSQDNGRTWSKFEPLQPSSNIKYKGVTVWEGAASRAAYDAESGLLLDMWLRQINVKGQYCCATYYRQSADHGRTWTAPKQLVYEQGPAFDPANPLEPAFLKRNQAYPGNNTIKLRDGTLLHCASSANAPGDAGNDQRKWRMGALCFKGKWDDASKSYRWTAGKPVAISPALSSRGLMESEVAELADGRILVVWRGTNSRETPGRKWYALSSDGGRTLSEVKEWVYDEGSRFYSPSSYHRTIRHSVTKKLYWIGNVCTTPPVVDSPRYPLVIGEIDETKAALKKATITAIDDRRPGQGAAIQFSNFSLLENRETHCLELHLTTYGQEDDPKNWASADNYKYTVRLKE